MATSSKGLTAGIEISSLCAISRLNLGDKIVLRLVQSHSFQQPENPESENPKLRDSGVFAGSLALKAGACARAACVLRALSTPKSQILDQ